VCRRFICPIFDTPLGHLDWQVWIFARTHGPRGSSKRRGWRPRPVTGAAGCRMSCH
jgi:hypothetical protein